MKDDFNISPVVALL